MKKRILSYLKSSTNLEEQYLFQKLLDQLFQPDQREPINGNQSDIINLLNEKRRFRINRKYLAAATVAMLLGISVLCYVNISGSSTEKFFNSYYSPYKVDYNFLSRVSPAHSSFMEAVQVYHKGSYKKAIIQLREIIKTDTSNTIAYFLLGISFMETQNYQEAIKNLMCAIDKADGIMEQAQWYLALCYLHTNQTKEATQMLNNIANINNYHQRNAIDLLKKLQ
jgi:tetratricopeptide (TPR) repeat protein